MRHHNEKNGQSQKPRGVFQKPRRVFKTLRGVFPHIFKWGKNPAGFFQKNKYQNKFKKEVCLIVIISENDW